MLLHAGDQRSTGLPSKKAASETLYATASATSDENVTFTPPFSMDAQVLRMETRKFGSLLLGEVALGTDLSKANAEGTLGALDRLLERRAETNL